RWPTKRCTRPPQRRAPGQSGSGYRKSLLAAFPGLSQSFRHRLIRVPEEVNAQIAGEQGIGLGAGDCFLRVLEMVVLRSAKSHQRRRELHLRVVSAQSQRTLHLAISIEPSRWI